MNQFTPTTRPLLLFFCYRVLSILRVTRPFSTWSRRSMRRRHGTFRLLAVHWTCACGCACASAYMSVPSRNSTAAPFPRVSIATRQEHSGWLWTTEHNGERKREREKEKERAGQMKCEIHFMRARSSTRFRHFFSSPFHSLLFSSLLFSSMPGLFLIQTPVLPCISNTPKSQEPSCTRWMWDFGREAKGGLSSSSFSSSSWYHMRVQHEGRNISNSLHYTNSSQSRFNMRNGRG